MTEEFVTLLVEKGVTVFIIFWFALRFERAIQNNTEAINHLHDAVIELKK